VSRISVLAHILVQTVSCKRQRDLLIKVVNVLLSGIILKDRNFITYFYCLSHLSDATFQINIDGWEAIVSEGILACLFKPWNLVPFSSMPMLSKSCMYIFL